MAKPDDYRRLCSASPGASIVNLEPAYGDIERQLLFEVTS